MDWLGLLRERGNLARRMTKEIDDLLETHEFTADQVHRLFVAVNKHCLSMERIIERLKQENASERICSLAESVHHIWKILAEEIDNRLIDMQRRQNQA